MQVFHWGRPVGNYVFFESQDQCLQGGLGLVVISPACWGESVIRGTTVADPCNRP